MKGPTIIKPVTAQAGRLRKRLQLQALPAAPPTAAGWTEQLQADADWATLATLWGEVKPLTGRELSYANEVVADATHLVTTRYYPNVTAKMRFKYTDDRTGAVRIFNIADPTDVEERHVKLECLVHEA